MDRQVHVDIETLPFGLAAKRNIFSLFEDTRLYRLRAHRIWDDEWRLPGRQDRLQNFLLDADETSTHGIDLLKAPARHLPCVVHRRETRRPVLVFHGETGESAPDRIRRADHPGDDRLVPLG